MHQYAGGNPADVTSVKRRGFEPTVTLTFQSRKSIVYSGLTEILPR
jgi:hypothetical protein